LKVNRINLKNRPKIRLTKSHTDEYIKDINKFNKWFEEFEKELRIELKKCDIGLPYCEKCEKIMEILGETE